MTLPDPLHVSRPVREAAESKRTPADVLSLREKRALSYIKDRVTADTAQHLETQAERAARPVLPLGLYWDLLETAEEAGNLTPEHFGIRDYRYRAEGIYSFLRTIANRYGAEHQALFFAFVNYAETHVSKPERPVWERG